MSVSSSRKAVVVLGMHRSGTSALSGVIAKLGAQTPRHLMVPTRDNPKGYFESNKLKVLNDRILAYAGSKWSDWCGISEQWLLAEAQASFVAEMKDTLTSEFGDAGLFVLKDPRFCLTAPILFAALRELAIEPRIILSYRRPTEVAASLAARDGMARTHALLLWIRHFLDAERWSRGYDRMMVDYPDLIRDWRGVADDISTRLGVAWPKTFGLCGNEIDEFVDASYRHHVSDDGIRGGGKLGRWLEELEQARHLVCAGGSKADTAAERMDTVRAELGIDAQAYWPSIDHFAKRAAEGAARIGDLERELDQTRSEISTREDSARAMVARVAELEAEARQAQELRTQLEAEARQAQELRAQLEAEARQAQELRTQLEDARRVGAETAETVVRLTSDNADLTRELANRSQAIQELEHTLQARYRELALLTDRLAQAEDERDGLAERFEHQRSHLRAAAVYRARSMLHGDSELLASVEGYKRALAHDEQFARAVHASWTWRLVRTLTRAGSWDPLPSPRHGEKLKSLEASLVASDLFDPEWYTALVGGAAALQGMSPIRHYLAVGAPEGLDPSSGFSTFAYLEANPDVRDSGMNPLAHYVLFGRDEGRKTRV